MRRMGRGDVHADARFGLGVHDSNRSIAVSQQAGTTLSGLTSVANGATVRVRGLLFFDGGTWTLGASRITGQ